MTLRTLGSSGGGSATRTRRGMAHLGPPGANVTAGGGFDGVVRNLVRLPVTTTRWRYRVRNAEPATPTVVTGAVTFSGVWVGLPDTTFSSAGAYNGKFAADATQALSGFSTPADGSEYVSSWVTASNAQFTANTNHLISVGTTYNGAQRIFSNQSEIWYLAGNQSSAGLASLTMGRTVGTPMDVIIEYEGSTSKSVGFFIGDSLTAGYRGSDATGWNQQAAFPEQFQARTGHLCLNYGSTTSTMTHWGDNTKGMWTRPNFGTDLIPDFAYVNLGSNDIFASATLATLQSRLGTILTIVRAKGISRVFLGTVPPRNFGATPEGVRNSYNAWLKTLPYGVHGVVDMDKVLSSPANAAILDPLVDSGDGTHMTPVGHARMAAAMAGIN